MSPNLDNKRQTQSNKTSSMNDLTSYASDIRELGTYFLYTIPSDIEPSAIVEGEVLLNKAYISAMEAGTDTAILEKMEDVMVTLSYISYKTKQSSVDLFDKAVFRDLRKISRDLISVASLIDQTL